MALTPFTGTVSAATLNANFDDDTSALATQMQAGQKDWTVYIFLATLTNATALSARTIAFTPQDDAEVRFLAVRCSSMDAGSRTLTATVTVDNGDTTFLDDQTISVSVTSAGAGLLDSRPLTDLRTATGVRVRLLKGVRYRLTMALDAGTGTATKAMLQLRSIRRRA